MTLDKSLGQSTIRKVHHRIQRLTRDRDDQRRQIVHAQKELGDAEDAVVREKQALLCARDDEAELVLRFIEAKLRHELLSDERSTLDDDIVQVRRDMAALDGDLQVKDRLRSRLAAVAQQRQNEVDATETVTTHCRERAQAVRQQVGEVVRELDSTRAEMAAEMSTLKLMQSRLDSIRESVAAAVHASQAGSTSRTCSPARQ